MKAEVKHRHEVDAAKFPKLMVSDKTIIVAISQSGGNIEGVALVGNGMYAAGGYSKTWNCRAFTDFTGTVTLSND